MFDAINPGLYILIRDVRNPRPDRRHRYSAAAVPLWRRGTRVEVATTEGDKPDCVLRVGFDGAEISMMRSPIQVGAIIPHLQPEPPSLGRQLRRAFPDDRAVGMAVLLSWLAEQSRTSPADVERAKEWFDTLNEQARRSMTDKHGL